MAKLTNEQLAEIRKRAEAATGGPWVVSPDKCGPEGQGVFNEEDFGCICEVGDPYPRGNNKPTENMNFIASARTDIPALLDMIAELQAENKLLESSFEESERNKNRYAENMRDYYAESQVWRLEHDHQKKQAEVYFEKYKEKTAEVAQLKRQLDTLGGDSE